MTLLFVILNWHLSFNGIIAKRTEDTDWKKKIFHRRIYIYVSVFLIYFNQTDLKMVHYNFHTNWLIDSGSLRFSSSWLGKLNLRTYLWLCFVWHNFSCIPMLELNGVVPDVTSSYSMERIAMHRGNMVTIRTNYLRYDARVSRSRNVIGAVSRRTDRSALN